MPNRRETLGVQVIPVVLLVVAALLQPSVMVNWSTWQKSALTVRAPVWETSLGECLESNSQARIRFEVQLCRRRAAWFDQCAEARTEVHMIEYDSITESYRVVHDRIGDGSEPLATAIPSRAEALASAVTVSELPLTFLAWDDGGLVAHARRYVQVRTIFTCNRSVGGFGRISQVLTLGLLNPQQANSSGWVDFDIDGAMTADSEAPIPPRQDADPRVISGQSGVAGPNR